MIYILYRGEYRKRVGSGQYFLKALCGKGLRAAHPKIGWAVWVGSLTNKEFCSIMHSQTTKTSWQCYLTQNLEITTVNIFEI